MLMKRSKQAAGIQYHGESGCSKDCLEAIIRLIQGGDCPVAAKLLTVPESGPCAHHAFLLSLPSTDVVAIKSGFSSGYGGEGPHTLSVALALLTRHGCDIEEYVVDQRVLDHLDQAALSDRELEAIQHSRPKRPRRWYDYVYDAHETEKGRQRLWGDYFPPVIPFAIVDPAILDLAISFWDDPNAKLRTGYCRLEETICNRTGLTGYGVKLFEEAFSGDNPKLKWEGCTGGNLRGRVNLFTGTYMAFRNPRAHSELDSGRDDLLAEFLQLNGLFRLLSKAIP